MLLHQALLITAAELGDEAEARRLVALLEQQLDRGGRRSLEYIPRTFTPLHAACANGHAAIVALLLEHGADASAGDNRRGCTPFQMTRIYGQTAAMAVLSDHNDNQEFKKDLMRMDEIIQYSHCPDRYHGTLLNYVCADGQVALVQLLLDRGYARTLNLRPFRALTPLHEASRAGSLAIVQLLLEHGADVQGVSYPPDPRKIGHAGDPSPLNLASEQGHAAVVKHLLEHGALLRWPDPDGSTSLCSAASAGHVAVVRTLLEFGADFEEYSDTIGKPGAVCIRSALHAACRRGKSRIVRLLLEYGADPDVMEGNLNGMTMRPLHQLCRNPSGKRFSLATLRMLLDRGAIVDARDSSGLTPLFYAAYDSQEPAAVRMLLECGANPSFIDVPEQSLSLEIQAELCRPPAPASLLFQILRFVNQNRARFPANRSKFNLPEELQQRIRRSRSGRHSRKRHYR